MKKFLTEIRETIKRSEPLSDAVLLPLTQAAQDAALAGQEIDAAQRLVTLVAKARRDANLLGKDTVAPTSLTAAIERARAHQRTAAQRLEKAAADFAPVASSAARDRRGALLVSKLRDGQRRLEELGRLLDKLPTPSVEKSTLPRKRWTSKSILGKAKAAGLRITRSRRDKHVTVWNRIGGITLWEDGTATRADVAAEFAKKMTLREAAEFLFPDER